MNSEQFQSKAFILRFHNCYFLRIWWLDLSCMGAMLTCSTYETLCPKFPNTVTKTWVEIVRYVSKGNRYTSPKDQQHRKCLYHDVIVQFRFPSKIPNNFLISIFSHIFILSLMTIISHVHTLDTTSLAEGIVTKFCYLARYGAMNRRILSLVTFTNLFFVPLVI